MDKPIAKRFAAGGAATTFGTIWLMADTRVRALLGKIAAGPPARLDDGGAPVANVTGYNVSRGIASIDICGVLVKYPSPEPWYDNWCGVTATTSILEKLSRAAADPAVRAIALILDCPGGTVDGTNELAEAVARVNRFKPVHALVSDLAASGGYYIASQCRSITCNAMGSVGSIGVYAVLSDTSAMMESIGIKLTTVATGGVKGAGSDGRVTPALVEDVNRQITATLDKFVADVAQGRGIPSADVRSLADGRVWIAPEALKRRLIDAVASVPDALAAIASSPGEGLKRKTPAPQPTGDPVAVAKAEWARDAGGVRKSFSSEAAYVGFRKSELMGRVNRKGAPGPTTADRPGAAPTPTPTSTRTPIPADPKGAARREWARMKQAERAAWVSESVFVAFRAAELRGSIKLGGPR